MELKRWVFAVSTLFFWRSLAEIKREHWLPLPGPSVLRALPPQMMAVLSGAVPTVCQDLCLRCRQYCEDLKMFAGCPGQFGWSTNHCRCAAITFTAEGAAKCLSWQDLMASNSAFEYSCYVLQRPQLQAEEKASIISFQHLFGPSTPNVHEAQELPNQTLRVEAAHTVAFRGHRHGIPLLV